MTTLRDMAERTRPLHIALAHVMANTRLCEQERHALLNRLFLRLTLAEQILCTVERKECSAARAGRRFAVVK